METIKAVGTSPVFKNTGEELKEGKYHHISSFEIKTKVTPPQINDGNAFSLSMTKWIQPWPEWNFEKISEPQFDGICKYLGIVSNKPDYIKDYHVIGLMRSIDFYLAPTYSAYIECKANGVASAPPPTEKRNRVI